MQYALHKDLIHALRFYENIPILLIDFPLNFSVTNTLSTKKMQL